MEGSRPQVSRGSPVASVLVRRWIALLEDVAAEEPIARSGIRKIVANVDWELPYSSFEEPGIHYRDLCYSEKGKHAQLARNYWDQAAVDAAILKLQAREGKDHSSVTINLQGATKDSRSQGFCMVAMVITRTKTDASVDIFYRSTELIQKFAADLVFFSKQLPTVFEDLPFEPSVVRFHFANVYLSAMFIPIVLKFGDGDRFFSKMDPKFYRTAGMSTRRYFKVDHNYTYRTRVKLFEYWKENVDESKLQNLKKELDKL